MTNLSDSDFIALISAELRIDPALITADSAISDVPGWDSLAWIRIISAIEGTTGKLFPVDNIEDVKCLKDLFILAQG